MDLRFKNQLMGQPLAHNLILTSISSHIKTENPSKALVLSLHGSTGTGRYHFQLAFVNIRCEGHRGGIGSALALQDIAIASPEKNLKSNR